MLLKINSRREGKVLALFALLLPALLGFLGLVIDAGILLAAHRQLSGAADAAALAAALDLLHGDADPRNTAEKYIHQHHGLTQAGVTVNIPPSQGSYAGDGRFVEVMVENASTTWFIHLLGAADKQKVRVRAVAGYKRVAAKEAILALDPEAVPGLNVDGTAAQVNGRITVNSQGAGLDETHQTIDLGYASHAVSVNGSSLKTTALRVVGGVDAPASIGPISGQTSPLHAGRLVMSDPLLHLPTPTTNTGVVRKYPGNDGTLYAAPQHVNIVVEDEDFTLEPGIYASIEITGSGTADVTFLPGVYVLQGGNASGRALYIATVANVIADGVLFYNTGSNFDPDSGAPDSSDGNAPPGASAASFGSITLKAGQFRFTPLNDSSHPFDGLLIYQRRWNTHAMTIEGHNSADILAGTIYTRWGKCSLSGAGTHNCQLIAGSVYLLGADGNANLTIHLGTQRVRAHQVFLVE